MIEADGDPGSARLHWLRRLNLLNADADPPLDRLVRIAAEATAMPIALVTFVAHDRQWIRARHGWDATETSLPDAFCAHAMGGDDLLEFPDTTTEALLSDNALVFGSMGIRAYFGHPIVFHGAVLGTVCVLDRRARSLGEAGRAVLADLAGTVADLLEMRLQQLRATEQAGRSAALQAALLHFESTLQATEQRYRSLWATTTDAVLIVGADDIIRFANPAVEEVFGWKPAELLGAPLAMVQPERLREPHRRGMRRYLASGRRKLDWRATETSALRKDGTELPVEIAFSQLADGGQPMFAAFVRDISERKQQQAALHRSEAQLWAAQKLEAIGVLAGGLAHDFNNVVAGILGNAALAEAATAPDHPARHNLAQIRKSGERARDMVRQLLAFARRQPGQRAHVELAPLVDEAVALLKATLPAGIRLEIALPPEPLYLYADTTQIAQVLLNLVTNAWQAMGARGGRITIGARAVTARAGEAAALGLAPGRYIDLSVADDGPGIDPAHQPRVFEPFFTTKPAGEGTGLGLAVVHGIVGAHGGAVSLVSTPGAGCTFHLWLPEGEPVAQAPASPAHEVPSGGGRHVLYVDDDEVMTSMVQQLLELKGWRVTALTDAQQALERVRRPDHGFDAVVTDLNMPGVSGLEIVRAASAARPGLPLVLSSGNLPPELEAEAGGRWQALYKQNTLEELPPLLARLLDVAGAADDVRAPALSPAGRG
jgi:PAS domain S-box-containing protein